MDAQHQHTASPPKRRRPLPPIPTDTPARVLQKAKSLTDLRPEDNTELPYLRNEAESIQRPPSGPRPIRKSNPPKPDLKLEIQPTTAPPNLTLQFPLPPFRQSSPPHQHMQPPRRDSLPIAPPSNHRFHAVETEHRHQPIKAAFMSPDYVPPGSTPLGNASDFGARQTKDLALFPKTGTPYDVVHHSAFIPPLRPLPGGTTRITVAGRPGRISMPPRAIQFPNPPPRSMPRHSMMPRPHPQPRMSLPPPSTRPISAQIPTNSRQSLARPPPDPRRFPVQDPRASRHIQHHRQSSLPVPPKSIPYRNPNPTTSTSALVTPTAEHPPNLRPHSQSPSPRAQSLPPSSTSPFALARTSTQQDDEIKRGKSFFESVKRRLSKPHLHADWVATYNSPDPSITPFDLEKAQARSSPAMQRKRTLTKAHPMPVH